MASFSNNAPTKRSSHSFTKSKSDTGGIPKLNSRKQKAKSLIESGSRHAETDKSDQSSDDSDTNCNNLGFDLHYRFLFRSFRRSLSKTQVHHDDASGACVTTTFDKCTIQSYEKSSYNGNNDACDRRHTKKSATTSKLLHSIDFRIVYNKLQRYINKGILTKTLIHWNCTKCTQPHKNRHSIAQTKRPIVKQYNRDETKESDEEEEETVKQDSNIKKLIDVHFTLPF